MEKITALREWLGTGAINLFGLPMSGKDTQGVRLAEVLGARLLSSGAIIREMERESGATLTADGSLAPTATFYKWVLPYFERRELWHVPLVLSSIGRWHGEEQQVINVAEGAGHPLRAVVYLEISEEEAVRRWQAAFQAGAREGVPGGAGVLGGVDAFGGASGAVAEVRADDASLEIFQRRMAEFREKTLPVISEYRDLGLLVTVDGVGSREEVFERMITGLVEFSTGV